MRTKHIQELFEDSISVKKEMLDGNYFEIIADMGDVIVESIKNGGKLLLCGNGGSAADAQHLAAELLIRLRPNNNRQGLPAIALAQDTSTITACANDFGYEVLFERMVETIGNQGDVIIGITTSGKSENVNLALVAAKKIGMKAFGFLGCGGGDSAFLCDQSLIIPSKDTGRIQESHITAGHALMEYIEDNLINDGFISLRD
jgi:D-sedoheptulose 7-phosphate isomerase